MAEQKISRIQEKTLKLLTSFENVEDHIQEEIIYRISQETELDCTPWNMAFVKTLYINGEKRRFNVGKLNEDLYVIFSLENLITDLDTRIQELIEMKILYEG